MWQKVFMSSTHCGGGCTLGDLGSDILRYLTAAGSSLFMAYLSDFSAAYVLGVWFQYLPIRADRGLSRREAFIAAVKADTLSLLAFEVGLFLWMALVQKVWFGPGLTAANPVFWFLMQVGMNVGFVTTYPVNWALVRSGVKGGI